MTNDRIFLSWINSELITPEEKQELSNLSPQEIEQRFSLKSFKFGTSGIRALTGLGTQRLNRFTYRLIGISYSQYLKHYYYKPKILIVHDNRPEGQKWSGEIASALKSEGIEVFLAPNGGALSTPILSYLIRKKKLSGGISVTASHNPRNYNGLKIFNEIGKQLSSLEERHFRKFMLSLEKAITLDIPILDKSEFQFLEPAEIDIFFKELIETIPKSQNKTTQVPVLFSGYQGTTTHLMSKMAHDMGFHMFQEHDQRNLDYINPEDHNSFQELIERAEQQNIKYVMCSDLDGDRAAVAEQQADGQWYFFNGNEMGVMLAHFKYTHQSLTNPYIVSTHVTGTLINQVLPDIPIFLSQTGFKHISEVVDDEESDNKQLLIAFEEACGTLISPIHREKDGYQQIGCVLEMIGELNQQGRSLLSYMEELSNTPIGHWKGQTSYFFVDKKEISQFRDDKAVHNLICEDPFRLINTFQEEDIVVWQLENHSWIKFRYSGTEPKLKIYYNLFSKDKNKLEAWMQAAKIKFNVLLNNCK